MSEPQKEDREYQEDDTTIDAEQIPEKTIIAADDIKPDRLLILPLPNRPVFPHMIIPIILPPGKAANILLNASESPSKFIGLVLKKEKDEESDDTNDIPEVEIEDEQFPDIYSIGTAARIEKVATDDNNAVHAVVSGRARFKIIRMISEDPPAAKVTYFEDVWDKHDKETKAYAISIVNTLKELIKLNPLFNEEMRLSLSESSVNEPGKLSDFAASLTSADKEDLQEVLELIDVNERLKRVLTLLKEETEIARLKEKINKQIEQKLSKQQREFFLKEQLKAIKEELGIEKEGKTTQLEEYEKRLEKLTLPEEVENTIHAELEKFKLISPQSPEFTMLSNYLDWLLALPWGMYSKENYAIARARTILDKEHYGLEKVKERILEFIGVSKLKQSTEGSILCFIGPPGVGKTSLGQAIAKALNRSFFRFSLGGMRDEAEIKGHRRTYIGAMPGKIIQALKRCETANPLIMLDEIDKVGNSFRGDPASALLEVLDPEQNRRFLDHYLDVNFDLSKVLFIATANIVDTIPPALLDRMEVTKMSGYIKDEKIGIARNHLIPKQLEAHGLASGDITIHKSAVGSIIDSYTREAGVRKLEDNIKTIMRKTAADKAEHDNFSKVTVLKSNLDTFLGKKKFTGESFLKLTQPGVVIGLAWTRAGGSILFIESNGAETGKSSFEQTGQLGDVMIESSRIAYAHIRSIWPGYAPEKRKDFFSKNAVHLHVPAGATPKDGPSAGITMGISLISVASGIPVRKKIGMTGELTLTGRVLPIGGLKEKLIAASTYKLKDVIIPEENRPDYEEIPDHLKKGITIHFVKEFKQVTDIVFGDRIG